MSIKTWKEIDWPMAEKTISRLQQRIYKASLNNHTLKMHRLQRRLICNEFARAIAIKRVTELNRGRKTPGVDRIIVTNQNEKLKLLKNLKLDGQSLPIRRISIPKPGREKRPLRIPSMEDRSKQMLVKLALEPEWEAKFEPNSYGFRPGRSCHDAIRALFLSLRGKKRYILDADIDKCFDKINHDKLLKKMGTTAPIEKQIRSWLKSDILMGFKDQERNMGKSESGTSQGGIISPLLMNIALHGMEKDTKKYYVEKLYDGNKNIAIRDRLKQVGVYRYEDDFIITAKKAEHIDKIKAYINQWLQSECNLTLSKEKTKSVPSTEGFEFLGFHIITVVSRNKYVTRIHTSTQSKKNFLAKTREVIQKNKAASSAQLIKKLNPIIVGWCNYFRYSECVKDFTQVEYALFGQIRAWVFRRKSKGLKTAHEIKRKYFPPDTTITFNKTKHKGNWILVGEDLDRQKDKKQVFLVYPSWIKSENYGKIKDCASPFDGNHLYWAQRSTKYGSFNTTERKLLKKQHGKCTLCGLYFKPGETLEKDHILRLADGGKETISNLQIVHRHCHDMKTRKEKTRKKKLFKPTQPFVGS
jgi:RNA-directed DNA polymerase